MITTYGELVNQIELGHMETDSDIEDFAIQHNITYNEALKLYAKYAFKDTPCAGCKHICNRFHINSPICYKCSRRVTVEDMYEKE